jgi:hypothetical protein
MVRFNAPYKLRGLNINMITGPIAIDDLLLFNFYCNYFSFVALRVHSWFEFLSGKLRQANWPWSTYHKYVKEGFYNGGCDLENVTNITTEGFGE